MDGNQIEVTNTIWSPYANLAEGAIVHLGTVVKGTISVGDKVEAEVDLARRFDIARNHTATHLLQAALRQVLGRHVQQRGSLVQSNGFRFDFSHLAAISKEQLDEIQQIINERVRENLPVRSRLVPYQQAVQEGAIALFEEKYGETVRVLEIGDPPMSAELCGGTHVKATGEIGLFIIMAESSIGTGFRRIEAVTGGKAEELVRDTLSTMNVIATELRGSPSEIVQKLKTLVNELDGERKRAAALERQLSQYTVESLLNRAEKVKGITVLSARVPPTSSEVLRQMGDSLKDRFKSAVIVLGTVYDDKPSFVAMVTSDLVSKGLNAGDIVKHVASVTGGSGGGKASMAQAGGKEKSKIDEALGLVRQLVQKIGK